MTDTTEPTVPAAQPNPQADQTGATAAPDRQADAASGGQATGPTGPSDLTDDDRSTLRSAAMLAAAWVSRVESGFLDTFKESFAASKAIKAAPPEVQQLVVGGFPELPRGSAQEVEARTTELLRAAAALLRAKAPALEQPYRTMVVQSCRDVAAAADDTSGSEQAAIAQVEAALAG